MKQLTLSVHTYSGQFNGLLPPCNFSRAVQFKRPDGARRRISSSCRTRNNWVFTAYTTDRPDAGYLGAQFVPLPVHVCPTDPTQVGGVSTQRPRNRQRGTTA